MKLLELCGRIAKSKFWESDLGRFIQASIIIPLFMFWTSIVAYFLVQLFVWVFGLSFPAE